MQGARDQAGHAAGKHPRAGHKRLQLLQRADESKKTQPSWTKMLRSQQHETEWHAGQPGVGTIYTFCQILRDTQGLLGLQGILNLDYLKQTSALEI